MLCFVKCDEGRFPSSVFTSCIARNSGHFAPVNNCQRNLISKMADKNDRSQGKRIPSDFLNNLSSVLRRKKLEWNTLQENVRFILGRAADSNKTVRGCTFRDIFVTILF